MESPLDLLVPRPREARPNGEVLRLPAGPVPERRREIEAALGDQGYRLDVSAAGVDLAAGSPAGLFYAAATLEQWIELHRTADGRRPAELPGISIRDRPDFPVRGVMLDVSRDKVPTLATLFATVDLLAGLKLNQLQLYTEHTFAYRGHEAVWRDASPLTPDDVRALDDYCAERFVELVPNQQSFGHLHRWLVHEPYRRLAECPEGLAHPFSLAPEPFSLCPSDPGSCELLAGLYDQLLPCFRSRLFNVGCDETIDLGLGRSREECEERGRGRVYLDFLHRVHALVAERGRRMQLWGDVVLQHPELATELPADAVVLEWGYEADHPFAEDCRRFAEAGRDFYVCPGTSSWSSFAGRTDNAVANLASAAVHGHAHGAAGYLVTDWGDYGHLQPLPVSWPGLVAGAAFAWNVAAAREPHALPLPSLLDRHVFRDRARRAGGLVTALGTVYREAGAPPANGSALFFLVVFALLERERDRTRTVTVEGLARALERVESAAAEIPAMRLARGDAELVERELAWVADMLAFACRLGRERWASGDLSTFAAIAPGTRRELERRLRELVERHREGFLARNRPGGLERSAGWLERTADLLGARGRGTAATASAMR